MTRFASRTPLSAVVRRLAVTMLALAPVQATLAQETQAPGTLAQSSPPPHPLLQQDWSDVEQQAEGQTVYFNAWGGDPNVNGYLDWVAGQLDQRYDVELVHVKLEDTAAAVSRVLAEKSAGNVDQGAIDLIWINGENFSAMKENGLLLGPFAQRLPNFALTSPDANPEMTTDFTVPTDGYESPWGKAQLTFYYDSDRVDSPPQSLDALMQWSHQHPGRFTYPLVPDFHGSTFLKQALLALVDDPAVLSRQASEVDAEAVMTPLWDYLDALHPQLWRQGRDFPASGPAMRSLMGDGELSLAFTFNPAEPAAAVSSYQLPPSIRSYVLEGGTIGNVHFVTIPFNASHVAGAMVTANFLLSPEAQARKQQLDVWGDPTVLDLKRLDSDQRDALTPMDDQPARLPVAELQNTLPEPHPSWMEAVEAGWLERYGTR
ncbi:MULTISPECIES: ABC transporter substrate-binding protein [Halomonas]|uniref:ABC transporter substrate-binding protein n=1 Tax=Halomonas TaxID=2745 RepID=UPI001CD4458B|nr:MULTISPECIES: ABC transporter substrate-binding protein [Halomonas]MCA0916575.1 ABC transporter substrate-binding protein [Halomonas denitrificans]